MRWVSEYVEHASFIADGDVDAHGNQTEAWGDAVSVGVYGFDPGSSSEPREGMDRVIVEPTLYAPADVVFGARDRITARGHEYEVQGDTREWRHPDGHRPGNVISLRRVDG